MENWHRIPNKENPTFEEKAFNTSLLSNKYTYSLLQAMNGFLVNTEQFKMLQIQYSPIIENESIKDCLLSDKFITYLKNSGLIEHVKKKETPYKDKSHKLTYYKGMYFTSTEKARILLDKMRAQFQV
jgi:hypothetical protein